MYELILNVCYVFLAKQNSRDIKIGKHLFKKNVASILKSKMAAFHWFSNDN